MDIEKINVELQQAGIILMPHEGISKLVDKRHLYISAYEIEDDRIIICDNTSGEAFVEEFPISDYKEAIAWGKGEIEYSDYLEEKINKEREIEIL